MFLYRLNVAWKRIFKVFASSVAIVLFLASLTGAYLIGAIQGYRLGQTDAESEFASFLSDLAPFQSPLPLGSPTATPTPRVVVTTPQSPEWGGPELWEAVNDKRVELGVNTLGQRDELCTIASIRLNQLLALGGLDAHEGFSNLEEERPDLAYIFEKYSTVAEFLALGGESAKETVGLWQNTLGHKKLLTGGEYVWGCIYAQNSFAVAIAAF